MTFTWTGNGFIEVTFLASQILTDPNLNLNYFDQNYMLFYPISLTTTPTSSFVIQNTDITAGPQIGTVFTDNPSLSGFVSNLQTQLIQSKYSNYLNSNSYSINSYTQSIPSLVANTISAALSAFPASGANAILNYAAPTLVDPGLNFAMSEISNWPNGAQIISGLTDILSNLQVSTVGAQRAIQSVIDFKTKLLRQAALNADQVRNVQANSQNFITQNTFAPLASAFPQLNNLKNAIQTNNLTNVASFANFLPSSLIKGAAGSFIGPLFQSVLGGNSNSWPTIVNVEDKLLNDVQNLQQNGTKYLPVFPNITGFSNISSLTSFVNQALGVANNALNNIPVVANSPLPPNITNDVVILEGLNNYAEQTLLSNQPTTPQEQSLLTLLNYMSQTSPPASTQPSDPNDSSVGGSFMRLLNSFMPTPTDPTVTGAPANFASDATIQASQNARNLAQKVANLGQNNAPQSSDSCINPLLPPAQTPRMISTSDLSPTQYPPNNLIFLPSEWN